MKRDLILTEALRLFSENGLERTGLKEIAAALGMTHPALYYYFGSKEALVFQAVARAMEELIAVMAAAIDSVPPHPSLQLAAVARAQAVHELRARATTPFINAYLYGPLRNAAALGPRERDAVRAMQRRIVAFYREPIERGQAAGEFVAGPASVLAFGALGSVSYTVFWFRESGPLGLDEVAERIATQVVRSVSAHVDDAVRARRLPAGAGASARKRKD